MKDSHSLKIKVWDLRTKSSGYRASLGNNNRRMRISQVWLEPKPFSRIHQTNFPNSPMSSSPNDKWNDWILIRPSRRRKTESFTRILCLATPTILQKEECIQGNCGAIQPLQHAQPVTRCPPLWTLSSIIYGRQLRRAASRLVL